MLPFKNTFKNDHFSTNVLLKNPSLLIPFSIYNVMLLGRGLRNGTVIGLLAKKRPNQFTEYQHGFFIAMMLIQEEQNSTGRNIMRKLNEENQLFFPLVLHIFIEVELIRLIQKRSRPDGSMPVQEIHTFLDWLVKKLLILLDLLRGFSF